MTKFNRQRVKAQKQVPSTSPVREKEERGNGIVFGVLITFIGIVMFAILLGIIKENTMDTYYEQVEYRYKVGNYDK